MHCIIFQVASVIVSECVCLSVCLSVCQPACLSLCVFAYLSACLSHYSRVFVRLHLSVCLSVFLCMYIVCCQNMPVLLLAATVVSRTFSQRCASSRRTTTSPQTAVQQYGVFVHQASHLHVFFLSQIPPLNLRI